MATPAGLEARPGPSAATSFSSWRARHAKLPRAASRQDEPRHEGLAVTRGEHSIDAPGRRSERRDGVPIAGADETGFLSQRHYTAAREGFQVYDPTQWLPTLKLSISSAFMWYPWALMTGFAVLLCFYVEVVQPELRPLFSAPIDAHVVMGGALSFLIVFRTNASYDRWWEARCSWQKMVTICRGLAVTVGPALRDGPATEALSMHLVAFGVSLKAFLRDEKIQREELGTRMQWPLIEQLNRSSCPPLTCLRAIAGLVRTSLPDDPASASYLDSALCPTIYTEANEGLRALTDTVGVCERIKTTPMTFGYIAVLRSFLVLWLVTLPLSLVGEYGWLTAPILSLITYIFLTVEQMAIEIEQPFGNDENDLPLEEYLLKLEGQLLEMLTPAGGGGMGGGMGGSMGGDTDGGCGDGADDAEEAKARRQLEAIKGPQSPRKAPASPIAKAPSSPIAVGQRVGKPRQLPAPPADGPACSFSSASLRSAVPRTAGDPSGSGDLDSGDLGRVDLGHGADASGFAGGFQRLLGEGDDEVLKLLPSSAAFYQRYRREQAAAPTPSAGLSSSGAGAAHAPHRALAGRRSGRPEY